MATGKRYSTDYLVDSNNNTGSTGQVLTSTLTGIDWADGSGSSIIGGPYLPLSAGSGFPLTGDLYINKSAPALRLNDSGSNKPYELRVDAETFSIKEVSNSRTLMSITTGAVITLDSLGSNTVINTSGAMIVPNGNVGIGVTGPAAKLEVTTGGTKALSISNSRTTTSVSLATMRSFYTFGITQFRGGVDTGLYMSNVTDNIPGIQAVNSSDNAGSLSIQPYGGNVGIGTTSPGAPLHIKSTNFEMLRLQQDDANGGFIRFLNTDDTSGWYTGIAGTEKFIISRTPDNSVPMITVEQNGNVGIGTESPGHPLEIAGSTSTSIAYQRTGVSAKKWGFHSDNDATYWQNITDGGLLFTLKNGGSVGIGTTNPQRNLVVSNAGASGIEIQPNHVTGVNEILSFNRSSSVYETMRLNGGSFEFEINDNEKMRITAGGNVGIGTTTPTTRLNPIVTANSESMTLGSADNMGFKVGNTSTNLYGICMGVGDSGKGWIQVGRTDGTATAYDLSLQAAGGNVGIGVNNPLSKLHILDSSSTATKLTIGASGEVPIITAGGTNTDLQIQAVGPGGFLNFITGTSGASRMLINSAGKVGIGTTSTAADSLVTIGTTASTGLTLLSVSNAGESFINFADTADVNVGRIYYGHGDNAMRFRTNDGLRMMINSSGNVGIGTTTINAKLTVRGNIDLQGEGVGNCGTRYIRYDCVDASTTNAIAITSAANIGIGKDSPAVRLDVADSEAGSGFSNGVARFENTIETSSGGAGVLNVANNYQGGFGTLIKFWFEGDSIATINFNSSTNAVVYNTTSDYRLKEDLKSFNGLEIIDQIKTYNYKWKKAEARGYGALAHELQEVFPDAVTGEKDAEDMQGVDYSTLVPVLIKSIQELKVEIELLKQQINN